MPIRPWLWCLKARACLKGWQHQVGHSTDRKLHHTCVRDCDCQQHYDQYKSSAPYKGQNDWKGFSPMLLEIYFWKTTQIINPKKKVMGRVTQAYFIWKQRTTIMHILAFTIILKLSSVKRTATTEHYIYWRCQENCGLNLT